MMTIRELLKHPITGASGVFAGIATVFQIGAIDALAGVVWTQVATLFTVFSISAFTVLPNVDLGPLSGIGEIATVLALVFGVLYVAKLVRQVGKSAMEKL